MAIRFASILALVISAPSDALSTGQKLASAGLSLAERRNNALPLYGFFTIKDKIRQKWYALP
jgi:hypothetical protein